MVELNFTYFSDVSFKCILPPFLSFDVLGLQLNFKIFNVLVYLIFFPKVTLVEKDTINF